MSDKTTPENTPVIAIRNEFERKQPKDGLIFKQLTTNQYLYFFRLPII